MRIRVLGSAAGGGFPQWNCNCRQLRRRAQRHAARAARAPSRRSPCSRRRRGLGAVQRLARHPARRSAAVPPLQPARALRDTAIAGVVLMDGQIDHATGLFMLREALRRCTCGAPSRCDEDLSSGNPVLACSATTAACSGNRIALDARAVQRRRRAAACSFARLPLSSKAPPYSPHRDNPLPGDNIGMLIADPRSGAALFYAPGLGQIDADGARLRCRRRLRAGRRHLLDRRRDVAPGTSAQACAATSATCRKRARRHDRSGWTGCRRRSARC